MNDAIGTSSPPVAGQDSAPASPSMKVLHAIPSLDPAGGGVAMAAAGMAIAQRRAGAAVTMLSTRAASDGEQIADALRAAGVTVRQLDAAGKLYRTPALPGEVE